MSDRPAIEPISSAMASGVSRRLTVARCSRTPLIEVLPKLCCRSRRQAALGGCGWVARHDGVEDARRPRAMTEPIHMPWGSKTLIGNQQFYASNVQGGITFRPSVIETKED